MQNDRKKTLRYKWLNLIKNFKFLSPETQVKVLYERYTGKQLNLDNPVTFNEKLQWYKLYYKNPLLTQLADKYEVRSYVKERVGEQYLNELLGVYEDPSEIDYDALPKKFVLKGVHGCGFNLIVKDKETLDKQETEKTLERWLAKDYSLKGMEWVYKNIKPLIIAEAYLEEPGKPVLNDYKFYCFDGKVNFIKVDVDRGINHLRANYDTEWKKLPFSKHSYEPYEGEIPEPSNLKEMIEVSEKLAAGLPFVRVDLYSIQGKTLFGEMTFYPASGLTDYSPDSYNKSLGDAFVLPEKWT